MRTPTTLLAGLVATSLAFGALAEEKAKTDKVKIGPAYFDVPAAWQRQRSSNEMRVKQYAVPLAEGDEGKCEFVVFYFGGQGGGVEENVKRWIGMFEEVDGKEKIEKITADKFKITALDVTGSYKDKPFPMAQDFKLRKDWRMLAAVVETPDDGPYFFRVVGPKKTVGANADGWIKMLKSAKSDG